MLFLHLKLNNESLHFICKRTNLQKIIILFSDNIRVIGSRSPKFKINLQRKYKNCFSLITI